jgi:hypothetical protein
VVDGAGSLRLLARAVRAQDLLLITVDTEREAARLRAAYAIDGVVRARGERFAVAPTALAAVPSPDAERESWRSVSTPCASMCAAFGEVVRRKASRNFNVGPV